MEGVPWPLNPSMETYDFSLKVTPSSGLTTEGKNIFLLMY